MNYYGPEGGVQEGRRSAFDGEVVGSGSGAGVFFGAAGGKLGW